MGRRVNFPVTRGERYPSFPENERNRRQGGLNYPQQRTRPQASQLTAEAQSYVPDRYRPAADYPADRP